MGEAHPALNLSPFHYYEAYDPNSCRSSRPLHDGVSCELCAEAVPAQTAQSGMTANRDAPLEEVNIAAIRLATLTTTKEAEAVRSAIAPPLSFIATAYCLRGRTASGKMVAKGMIAADRTVLPLGTRVRLEAGAYSGEYLVTDTGGAIRGRKIDIWIPSSGEALRFGRRKVKLTVLNYGGRKMSARARR